MAKRKRINTKLEIIEIAMAQFLENGYTSTHLPKIAQELGISLGNLTFHFPTKDHLLAELVRALCDFQWKIMESEAKEGKSSLLAYCLEFATITSVCEEEDAIKDMYIAVYTHPIALSIVRENDTVKMSEIFAEYCPDWTEQDFRKAEAVVSGIEYGITSKVYIEDIPLDERVAYGLDSVMQVFGVPEEVRKAKVSKVLEMDYKGLGRKISRDFYNYVKETNANALKEIADAKEAKAKVNAKKACK